MRRVGIGGVIVEVDEVRTAELYDEYMDWCQCDGCINARMTRLDATPPKQAEILTSLGLNPRVPYFSSAANLRQRPPRGRQRYGRRNSCWIAYGKIVGAEATPTLPLDKAGWLRVDTERSAAARDVEGLEHVEADGPDLVYIVTSNVILWLYDEVAGFRSDYVKEPCPACDFRWRETGYLKRDSLIPQWKGLPQLAQVLRRRKERVYVEFCSKCGRMECRIVGRKPPFRAKNTLYDDEQKAQRRLGKSIRIYMRDFPDAQR